MASTSSSYEQKIFTYDIFLSFRGEDVRKNFVDHLYHALSQKDIKTYKDDEEIQKGEKVKDQLDRSIQDSRFHIIIFSKNYASSSWCLGELVQIMECSKTKDQTAYPIFYEVEPTEVRNQTGDVGEAFSKHVENEEAGRWRNAMKEVADLAGWELKSTANGYQAKFIQEVIGQISLKLHIFNLSVDENLIGMETRVKNVLSLLEAGVDDVGMVGIKGMGGGGKTTLARAIFNYISTQFDGVSFVENVREVSKASLSGLKSLQEQILKDVLSDQSIVIKSVSEGKGMMRRRMGSRKVLIILDDVDNLEQLQALVGGPTWFGLGSRIVITTRDAHMLAAHGENFTLKFAHAVQLLSEDEAICLFNKHAFKKEFPNQGYEELSKQVVNYAKGLPLTIRVLGSDLCGRTEHNVWKDIIERLKTIPEEQTWERLKISYDGLQKDHQEIFLDVACALKGVHKDEAIQVLKNCGYYAEYGLEVLVEKSLINISEDNRLLFHDLIEEMGKNIVSSEDPHSRLWKKEEIEKILVSGSGTKETRSINLANTNLQPSIIMQGLRKMTRLRLLIVSCQSTKLKAGEFWQYLPNSLRYLHWHGYPFRFLPKTFQASELVSLQMPFSNLSQLWEEGGEGKILNSLRFVNLRLSRKLRTFDLRMTPNLDTLNLKICYGIIELPMPIELPQLKYLNLSTCQVRKLNLRLTLKVETLVLRHCMKLEELHMPTELAQLKLLDLSNTKLRNLNPRMTPNLETLDITACHALVEPYNMFDELLKLKFLNLSYFASWSLHLRIASNLEQIVVQDSSIIEEVNMFSELPQLKLLDLSGCINMRKLNHLGMTPNIEGLYLSDCIDLVEILVPVECPKLKVLSLVRFRLNPGLTPLLEKFKNLEELGLSFDDLKHLPDNICMLKNLKELRLFNCRLLEHLPEDLGKLECLKELDLRGCSSLRDIPKSVGEMKCLKRLYISNSGVNHLPQSICQLKDLKIVR